MTVYVDDAGASWRGKRWYHLQADTLDELHAFAASIGLQLSWFQRGSSPEDARYDVTSAARGLAVEAGAVVETVEEGAARRAVSRTLRMRS